MLPARPVVRSMTGALKVVSGACAICDITLSMCSLPKTAFDSSAARDPMGTASVYA